MDGAKSIGLTARNDIELWAFEYEQPVPEISNDCLLYTSDAADE